MGMGDLRHSDPYARLRDAPDARLALAALTDEEVVTALAVASHREDRHLTRVLAVEAGNRMQRANAALTHLGDGVIAIDVNGRVTYANPAVEDILGWAPAALVGSDLHATLHATGDASATRTAYTCPILTVMDTGSPFKTEEDAFRHRDGHVVPISLVASPILREGDIVGAVVSFRDVTPWKRQEARIQESEERYRSLFEHNPDGAFMLDPEGRVMACNPAGVAMSGYAPDEITEMHFTELIADAHVPRAFSTFRRTLAGETQQVDIDLVRKDGTPVAARVVSVPMVVNGRVAGVHGVVKDVTASRAAEDMRAETLAREQRAREDLARRVDDRTRELKASNEELEAFSYMVSHDLRAPLRGIDLVSRALEEDYADALDADGRESLQRLRVESARMTALVNDLLTLSRVTRGEMTRERVDMTALARDVAGEFNRREHDRHVAFTVEDGLEAYADPRLMRVVLENLLGNAWKYTRRTPDPRVTFTASRDAGGATVFHVRDNGAGFPEEKTDELFTAFKRLHPAAEFEGTGVGLATVKRIVERHGGRAWAKGAPGEGATFSFTV